MYLLVKLVKFYLTSKLILIVIISINFMTADSKYNKNNNNKYSKYSNSKIQ